MEKGLLTTLSGIMAGMSIGLGCIAYLMIENSVVGAFVFTLGLFLVLVNGFALFTGRVAYVLDNKPSYIFTLGQILLGNFIGATGVGFLMRLTRFTAVAEKAAAMVATKSSGSMLSTFVLAVLCNILIFFAVDCYKNNKSQIAKYLGMLLLVPAFILCGYEHCVADMCYAAAANTYSAGVALWLLIAIVGNAVGAILSALGKRGVDALNSSQG